jgi:hypothetical protein
MMDGAHHFYSKSKNFPPFGMEDADDIESARLRSLRRLLHHMMTAKVLRRLRSRMWAIGTPVACLRTGRAGFFLQSRFLGHLDVFSSTHDVMWTMRFSGNALLGPAEVTDADTTCGWDDRAYEEHIEFDGSAVLRIPCERFIASIRAAFISELQRLRARLIFSTWILPRNCRLVLKTFGGDDKNVLRIQLLEDFKKVGVYLGDGSNDMEIFQYSTPPNRWIRADSSWGIASFMALRPPPRRILEFLGLDGDRNITWDEIEHSLIFRSLRRLIRSYDEAATPEERAVRLEELGTLQLSLPSPPSRKRTRSRGSDSMPAAKRARRD